MKLMINLTVLVGALLLTGCMQSAAINDNATPEWVFTEPELYPAFKYLSATGSAADAEQAKARALSNLAKIFEVQIREVSSTQQEIQTSKKGGIETVQQSQSLQSTVNLSTDKMVKGARIAEQWFNSADLSYHALAVLDRTQAGNNIRQEMSRLDEETDFVLNQQANRTDLLLKISDLHKANELQQDRNTLQQTLKIIDVNGTGAPARWSMAELHEQLQQTLRLLPLQIIVKADDTGGLIDILQGAASAAGFNIGDAGFQLAASLVAQQPVKKDGWFWLRGNLNIELIAEDGVTVIGYKAWPLKVSAGESSQLPARLREAADKKLKQELLNSVLEFAN